jgi:hypothetical protein
LFEAAKSRRGFKSSQRRQRGNSSSHTPELISAIA